MLGIVTDYSVFYFTSAREAMRDGVSTREAVRRSTLLNTPIVFTAGAVVAFGVASLMLGTLGFFRSFAPAWRSPSPRADRLGAARAGDAAAVRAGVVLAGARQDPRRCAVAEEGIGPRDEEAHGVGLALSVFAALGVAATGFRNGLPLGLQLVGGLPSNNPVVVSARAAGKGFAAGVVAPTELLLQDPGIQNQRPALDRLQAALERQPHVAGVVGAATSRPAGGSAAPSRRGGSGPLRDHLRQRSDRGAGDRAPRAASADAAELLRRVGLGGATVGWGGETALGVETVQATDTSLWRVSWLPSPSTSSSWCSSSARCSRRSTCWSRARPRCRDLRPDDLLLHDVLHDSGCRTTSRSRSRCFCSRSARTTTSSSSAGVERGRPPALAEAVAAAAPRAGRAIRWPGSRSR